MLQKNYTDMVLDGNKLYALTSSGHIDIIDINNNQHVNADIQGNFGLTAMALDHTGNIIVADKDRKIKVLNGSGRGFKVIDTLSEVVYNITLDNNDNLFLVTTKGVEDVKHKTYYNPDQSFRLNRQSGGGLGNPSQVFMDKHNYMWIGGAHGEWGGELFVFDTKNKRFLKPELGAFQMELWPVNTIFESDTDLYITFSLAHFTTSGTIVKFTGIKAATVLESKMYWKDTTMMFKLAGSKEEPKREKMKTSVGGEYIGPAAYNPGDSCIYFYSQNGIFKGNPAHDLSKIELWKHVASPTLIWTNGQVNAAGPANNMLKMAFGSNNKLYFLSQNNGIGMVDKGKVVMLQ